MVKQKNKPGKTGQTGEPARGRGAMDFDEIRRLLPQEEPFIFVDKVIELEKGKRITCLKNVSGSAPWVKSHFPGFAVMPGVLLLEALAQSSLILLLKSSPDHKNKIGLFGAVRARFLKPVVPGDQLIMEVKIDKAISTGAIVSAETVVNGEKVVTATLTFGIQEKK